MTSIAILEAVNTSYVPFNGQQVITAVAAGVTYVAMRQIVENIGMDWTGQSVKLRKMKDRFNCRDISMVAADGKLRKLLCLPLKKLNGWLFSINPEKVRADIRDKLIKYQEECFTVLHDYWTKGEVVNPRKVGRLSSATQLTPLRQTAERLIATGLGRIYPDIWKLVHKKFDIEHIHQLRPEQVFEAVEYLNALEGEYLGKANKQMTLPISYPMSYFEKYRWIIGDKALSAPWNYPAKMLTPNGDYPNPLGHMLGEMKRLGYEVDAALFQLLSLQHHLEVIRQKIDRIERAFH